MCNRSVFLCLPLILGSCALAADEAADRAAIGQTISALNQFPLPAGLFTDDAVSDLGRLPGVNQAHFQIGPDATVATAGGPRVVISREPWGEAQIYPPALFVRPLVIANPRIASSTVRFVTMDVAMVEGSYTRTNGDLVQTTPLLFLMKRDGDAWRIASARLLASN
jgi:hypothetical protein